jgi:hypothetical protein
VQMHGASVRSPCRRRHRYHLSPDITTQLFRCGRALAPATNQKTSCSLNVSYYACPEPVLAKEDSVCSTKRHNNQKTFLAHRHHAAAAGEVAAQQAAWLRRVSARHPMIVQFAELVDRFFREGEVLNQEWSPPFLSDDNSIRVNHIRRRFF